jgi:hypothetical protein
MINKGDFFLWINDYFLVNTNDYTVDNPVEKFAVWLWMTVDGFIFVGNDRAYPQSFLGLFLKLIHKLALDCLHQDMQVIVEPAVLPAQVDDGAASVHHGRVVPSAEGFADFRKAVRCKFTGEPHCNLTRSGDGAGAFLRIHVRNFDLVKIRHRFLHKFE